MFNSLRKSFRKFTERKTVHPILALVLASTYALLYYYDKNYAITNSKTQFAFLVSIYFLLPIFGFYSLEVLLKKLFKIDITRILLLTICNCITFLSTIVISLHGFNVLMLILALVVGLILGYLLRLHLTKIIIIQCILTIMVLPKLIPDLYREITYSKEWMSQPDDIENVKFKFSPNIYLIQPDGYTSFSTLADSIHNYDNNDFEDYLTENNFKIYNNYRSNYTSTLTSNSALFAMKHHYYGNSIFGINPRHNKRNEIVESNPVLRTLKQNNYKTFLMLQVPYLLSNRPDIYYDYCNISLKDIPYLSRGFSRNTNLLEDTKTTILKNSSSKNFFFIESMLPSHITTHFNANSSVENERKLYIKRIEEANMWLKDLISFIAKEDPNALVIIAADHGGGVGLNYFLESQVKTDNSLLINSMFSSLLAIKWPGNSKPKYDSKIKTSVNLFRVLFSYMSNNDIYINELQEDKSYVVIKKGAPSGVFEYIDNNSDVSFKKYKSKE